MSLLSVVQRGIDGLIIDSVFMSNATRTAQATITQNESDAGRLILSSVYLSYVRKFHCETRQHSVSNCCAFYKLDGSQLLFIFWFITSQYEAMSEVQKKGRVLYFSSLLKGS